MMSPDLIRAALLFLQRVDIKGGEAMAMVQVCQALEAMARSEMRPGNGADALQHIAQGEP
jgi:hypothetical protein